MCLLPLPCLSVCPHIINALWQMKDLHEIETFMRFNVGGLTLKSNFDSNWTKILLSFTWIQAHFSVHLDCYLLNICHNEKYVRQTIKKNPKHKFCVQHNLCSTWSPSMWLQFIMNWDHINVTQTDGMIDDLMCHITSLPPYKFNAHFLSQFLSTISNHITSLKPYSPPLFLYYWHTFCILRLLLN
jgi:hypothetical protein